MRKLDGIIHDLLQATEFVTIVTSGEHGPHLVGNWGLSTYAWERRRHHHLACWRLSSDGGKFA